MVQFCPHLPELCILPYIGGRSHIEEPENTGVKCKKLEEVYHASLIRVYHASVIRVTLQI
jgi:hypothetical protein